MKRHIDWRIIIILILIFIIGAAIIGRLFFLQILERKLFEAQALGQQMDFNNVVGSRGQILCAGSQETKEKSLAINKDSWTISVNPKDIKDKPAFAEALSKAISQTKEQIISELESADSYVVIQKNLPSDDYNKIKALNLKGLSFENIPQRFYPQGQMLSQVLGFLGGQGSGQYGVEGYYEDVLKGKSGVTEESSGINFLFSNDSQISLNGSDVYLTIDYNIQFQAEQLLVAEQKKDGIDAGQIIVMKPDTGKILALANFPNFDPNNYSKEKDLGIFQNSAVQKLFEPGSIMKSFTMAAALNEGKITPDTTYVDTGTATFGSQTIHNFANEVYGKQTMTQVLESSINTGAVFAEQQIPHKIFFDYIDKFGFNEKTGIDLQGEVYSRNDLLKNGPDIEFATAAFGQGIELTPMQIAVGYCAIANGGKLVKPYIVEKIANGKDATYTKPNVSQPIVSQQTITQLNSMLINVVDKGFNGVAKIPGYYFAGKTGTAQIPLKNGKGYMPDNNTIQSFVAYGPAFNPQFLILVKLDNPKVPKSSLSAVPVYKQLAQYIINYWQIPPDYDANAKPTN
ncbi:MAG: penicillin-binding protein 2 [Candidatus Staskawiczbacteria bacterium]|nr:penicillin-binding protein 2 [Candidatus Staskawiczbacteria bacterium]